MKDLETGHTLCILIKDGSRDLVIKEDDEVLGGIQNLRIDVSTYRIPPVLEIDVPDPTNPELSGEFRSMIQKTMEAARRHGFSVKLLSMDEMAIQENPEEQEAAEATLKEIVRP